MIRLQRYVFFLIYTKKAMFLCRKNKPLYDLTINLYDLTTINVTLYVYVIILVKIVVSLHQILKVTRKINNKK